MDLCSIILDKPKELLNKNNVPFFNNILLTIYFCADSINNNLLLMIASIIHKLIYYKDYTIYSGLLYNSIMNEVYGKNFISNLDIINSNPLYSNSYINPYDIAVMASINHPKTINNISASESPEIFEMAIIAMCYCNKHFTKDNCNTFLDILTRKDRNTMNALKFINYHEDFDWWDFSFFADDLL